MAHFNNKGPVQNQAGRDLKISTLLVKIQKEKPPRPRNKPSHASKPYLELYV